MSETFKIGQKVLVKGTWESKISEVEKITPTGLIKVDGHLYYPDGGERIAGSWHGNHIQIVTDEEILEFYKSIFINKVYNAIRQMQNNLTYEQAVEINNILKLGISEPKQN